MKSGIYSMKSVGSDTKYTELMNKIDAVNCELKAVINNDRSLTFHEARMLDDLEGTMEDLKKKV